MTKIKYVKNKDIDFIMWDRCIARSHNGNVFGYSWFLDSVCNSWDALVYGNYNAVLPLPLIKKVGITSVKNPKFLLKTNTYFTKEFDVELYERFLRSIPSQYKSVEIKTGNPKFFDVNFKLEKRRSYKLDLISPYSKIKSAYSDEFITKLEQIQNSKIFYNSGILPNGIVLLSTINKSLKKGQSDNLRLLSAVSVRRKLGEIYGAFSEKNRLFAAALFVSSHYKTYVVYAVQTKEASKKNAVLGLINHYIKVHSERALTLDFTGLRMMPDDFFEGIGATEYPEFVIKRKRKHIKKDTL